MSKFDYDAIVIGSGPGGEGAAMNLAKHKKRVALVERYKKVGGGCTHWGTIPSKALRHSVARLVEYNSSPLFHEWSHPSTLTFAEVLKHTESVIKQQVNLRAGFYDRNRVELLYGEARFIDANTIAINESDGSVNTVTAAKIIIATGSRPYRPSDIDFNHPRIYDSDTILSLQRNPRHIVIYGAGVIGCEYASIFRGLGVKVDLVNMRDQLLSFLDKEITDSLSYHLWNSGVIIRNNEEYAKVEGNDEGVVVHLKSGKVIKADCMLFANGRTGNTDRLDLDKVGLIANSRGQLEV
ncbi:MAG: FAD-dependent oxidoreductase, partial [Gammaproteobacteria bacterium]|nr:FAD-dependent oxidoreductase [Gammaproteobacteria bacterium]